jgi:hypothetical protein
MSEARRRPAIAVIGGAGASQAEYAAAERVGQLLAERGAVVVCGGGGGVMEAACRGAAQRGGLTVGILPGADDGAANAFLTVALPTGLGQARNALVVLAGQAVIAIGGGPGTLSEIGLALKAGRKVIGLHTWEARDPRGAPAEILTASSPEHAVALALGSIPSESQGGT